MLKIDRVENLHLNISLIALDVGKATQVNVRSIQRDIVLDCYYH